MHGRIGYGADGHAPALAIKPEFDAWSRQGEQDFLKADFQEIPTQIEELRI
ncbi:hypothetical protein [Brucella sp. 10RB9215]|uniref:hypothetical protein n=1 Tax=Brucella sp. 10RB9215 TaxID=1149953 RepID=UPI00155AAF28|nr:hypothetical protein [Brucella sp. 10RB9215]